MEHGRALLRQPRTQRRDLPIVGFLRRRRLHAPHADRMLPFTVERANRILEALGVEVRTVVESLPKEVHA